MRLLPPVELFGEQRCPRCGNRLRPRHSRHGPFVGCSRFPECRYAWNGELRPYPEPTRLDEKEFPVYKEETREILKPSRSGKNEYPVKSLKQR